MFLVYLLIGLVFSPLSMLFGYDWWYSVALAPLAFLLDAAIAGFDALIRKRRFNYILVDLAVFLALAAGLLIYGPQRLVMPVAVCLAIYSLVVLTMLTVLWRRGRLKEYSAFFQGFNWTLPFWL